jgi:hypothetical protein
MSGDIRLRGKIYHCHFMIDGKRYKGQQEQNFFQSFFFAYGLIFVLCIYYDTNDNKKNER